MVAVDGSLTVTVVESVDGQSVSVAAVNVLVSCTMCRCLRSNAQVSYDLVIDWACGLDELVIRMYRRTE
jgi:hypothetical protein